MKFPLLFGIIFILLILSSITAQAQVTIAKKYVSPGNDSTYIKFYSDSSFYYRYTFDLMHNRDKGSYTIKQDTILLIYNSFTDLADALSARGFRPDTLLVEKDKLYLVQNAKAVKQIDSTPLTFKPPRGWNYRRKYYLFGGYIPKRRKIYYMIDVNLQSKK